jgi:hypothetical protein
MEIEMEWKIRGRSKMVCGGIKRENLQLIFKTGLVGESDEK